MHSIDLQSFRRSDHCLRILIHKPTEIVRFYVNDIKGSLHENTVRCDVGASHLTVCDRLVVGLIIKWSLIGPRIHLFS